MKEENKENKLLTVDEENKEKENDDKENNIIKLILIFYDYQNKR
jgi:hypothetical protein